MEKKLDRAPFFWALAFVGAFVLVWQTMRFIGAQRFHNTPIWQRWNPVTLVSPPQTATPVETRDSRWLEYAVIQTERGLYFLTGTDYVPAASDKVIVETNDRWDLYMCAPSGDRCMTVHSFCADAVWPNIKRDEQGKIEGCFAPYLGSGNSNTAVAAITTPPPDRAGREGGRSKMVPAMGVSHPREWAWRMGLPISPQAPGAAAGK